MSTLNNIPKNQNKKIPAMLAYQRRREREMAAAAEKAATEKSKGKKS